MKLNNSPFTRKDKTARNLYKEKDYPTIADLIKEQNVANDDKISVHYRRDLDSLG